ncbi:Transcription termination protein NusB [hydrothermal vent metagenome]|uniref:Transcription termination protein NusB n=1 Tax=hydrothermal vent metagenome TaxID=652676 RepID=A0A3B0UE34_9ZZZZ
MAKNEKPRKSRQSGAKANMRSAARLGAVQALYQMEIGAQTITQVMEQFAPRQAGGELDGDQYLPADVDFLHQIVKGVLKNQLVIDPTINDALSDEWPVTRIDVTLRAMLRAGTFELVFRPDIPPNVVISEYVDVANAFYDGEAPAMLNAVLDKIAHDLPAKS